MYHEGQAQSNHHQRNSSDDRYFPQRAGPPLLAFGLKFTPQSASSGQVGGCGFGTAQPPVRSFRFGVIPLQGELAKPGAQQPPGPQAKTQICAQAQPKPQPQVEPPARQPDRVEHQTGPAVSDQHNSSPPPPRAGS